MKGCHRRDPWIIFLALSGFALVQAEESAAADDLVQADVVRGTGCVFFDANGAAVFVADAEFQIVATNNARGNANARCQGTLPDGAELPNRAMHWSLANTGFTCLG